MKLLSISLFLLIAFGVVGISVLIAPGQLDNNYFWITVGWLVFLSGLNWFVSTFILFGINEKNNQSKKFGILPSLNILVFIYSIISALFLLSTWFINDFIFLPNWHLISQLILLLITGSISILMLISAKAAETPVTQLSTDKDDLIKSLKVISNRNMIDDKSSKLLKELAEIIKYSMPHLSQIKSVKTYEQLVDNIKNIEAKSTENTQESEILNAIELAKNCF